MQIQDHPQLGKVLDAMTQFASTTENHQLSVEVARVAWRLQHAGKPFEKPLTRREISVIRPFIAHIAQAETTEAVAA